MFLGEYGKYVPQCSTSIPPDYLTKTNGFLKFSGDFERDLISKPMRKVW